MSRVPPRATSPRASSARSDSPRSSSPRRAPAVLGTALVAALAISAVPGPRAAASPARATQAPVTQPAPVPDDALGEDRIHPDLVDVPVDSPAHRDAVGRLRATESAIADAQRRITSAEASLVELRTAEAALVAEIDLAAKRRDKSLARIEELHGEVRQLAVASYVRGGVGTVVDAGLDLSGSSDDLEAGVLVHAFGAAQFDALAAHEEVVVATTATIERQTPVLAAVRDEITATDAALERARRDEAAATERLGPDRERVAEARVLAGVVGLDMPLVVLDAYYRAAAQMGAENPACGLRWEALAGIGRTESNHGAYRGASVAADGAVTPPIRGIPLDGSNGTAVVGDTDGGALDGDPGVDRAVGPMQFIPGSWRMLGRDGNGDGVADPDNLYDAALAAAGLLCRQGPGLDGEEGLRRATFTYNRSEEYVRIVVERTYAYDTFGL